MNDGKNINDQDLKDWVIKVCDKTDVHYTGLYAKIAPYAIFLRQTIVSWNTYLARFASPQPVVKTSMLDEDNIRNLTEYLSKLQNGSFAILHKEDEFEFVETQNANSDLFEKMINELKSSIARIIIGTDVLNKENSYVGSMELAEEQANMYSMNDIKFLERMVNEELFPRLVNLGLSTWDNKKIKFQTVKKQNINEMIDNLVKLSSAGYRFKIDKIADELGLELDDTIIENNNENNV